MHNLFAICRSVVRKTRHYQITEVYCNSFDWCMPVNPCLMCDCLAWVDDGLICSCSLMTACVNVFFSGQHFLDNRFFFNFRFLSYTRGKSLF